MYMCWLDISIFLSIDNIVFEVKEVIGHGSLSVTDYTNRLAHTVCSFMGFG